MWVLRDTVRCLALVEAFQAVLEDTAAVIRCKAVMVALKAQVDMLPTAKLATTAATRVNQSVHSKVTAQRMNLCDALPLFKSCKPKAPCNNHKFSCDYTSAGIHFIRS